MTTKLGNKTGSGPNERGLSRKRVFDACNAGLRRLGTDHIDIYYRHREDLTTPLAKTVRVLADLSSEGKIRYFGLSNFRAWRVAEVCWLCDELGIDRPVVSQPYYNLLTRMPETEHLPACGHYSLGVFAYSPLACARHSFWKNALSLSRHPRIHAPAPMTSGSWKRNGGQSHSSSPGN